MLANRSMTTFTGYVRVESLRFCMVLLSLLLALVLDLFVPTNGRFAMSEETGQARASIFGISLPPKIGVFERGKVTNNEVTHSGLGYSVAYSSASSGEATVYIYDKGLLDIPEGPMEPVIRREFDQATQDVLNWAQSREDQTTELLSRYGTGSPNTRREFLCSEFLSDIRGNTVRTFLCVTGAEGKFVKLRVTLTTDDPRDPTARNFADALAVILWGPAR